MNTKTNLKAEGIKMLTYTSNELSKINIKSETINIQLRDYDGNTTKHFGLNDKEALAALKTFIETRMKHLGLNIKAPPKLNKRSFDIKFWGDELSDILESDRQRYYENYLASGLSFEEYVKESSSD